MDEYKICSHCVMDTTDKKIHFDEKSVCDRCNDYEQRIVKWWNYGRGHEEELNQILNKIRESGKGKKYDCLLGLSGGLDSCYLLHKAVKDWNLRPFVFHVDAGWDLPVAIKNINKICKKLNVELHIEKLDYEEMRKMQLAFFKTGLPDLDAPQDHAFIAQVDSFAEKLNIKYILNGYNISTEVISDPSSWSDGAGPTADKTYIKDVVKKECNYKTKKYTYTTGFKHKFWLPYVKGVKTLQLLNYIPITKSEMIDTLYREYDYETYKYKHYENLLTKFITGWWLVNRFGYDMRKPQLSSLVVTGQLSREEAIEILKEPALSEEEASNLFSEVSSLLQITEEELWEYFNLPKEYKKYKNNAWAFRLGTKLYTFLGLDHRIRK